MYLLFSVLMVTAAASLFAQDQPAPTNPRPPRAGLVLTSPAFSDGGVIPAQPVSPKLEWKNVLPNTVSFVLIVHDLNTSIGGTSEDVLHWMVFNIPATVRELPAGVPIGPELPDGSIQGVNRMDIGLWEEAEAAGLPIISYSIFMHWMPNFLSDRKPPVPRFSTHWPVTSWKRALWWAAASRLPPGRGTRKEMHGLVWRRVPRPVAA
jgi:hypothetical protein